MRRLRIPLLMVLANLALLLSALALAVPSSPGSRPSASAVLRAKWKVAQKELRESETRAHASGRQIAILEALGRIDAAESLKSAFQEDDLRLKKAWQQMRLAEEEVSLLRAAYGGQIPRDGQAVILPGTKLELWVSNDFLFNGRYQVNSTGSVTLPIVGQLKVLSLTAIEVEELIRVAYQKVEMNLRVVAVDLSPR